MVYKNGKPVYNSWYQDSDGKNYYLDEAGAIVTKWKKIMWNNNKKYFYFNNRGDVVANTCKTIDNIEFCFDKNGVCISGGDCK